jgi:type II secretory ATPase GspE/PulE/Tfp pilus assembly ATPase PilB-like protein
MIGEIRDFDTLDIAVKAALTGHLVLSTLHTNSASSAVTRLLHMGLPSHLVGATLRLSVAQRLVRRLCVQCRRPRPLSEAESYTLDLPDAAGQTVYEAGGCIYCAGHGFAGRMGLFECMEMDGELAALLSRTCSEVELRAALQNRGFRSLRRDGAAKVLAGLTTIKEVVEATADYGAREE